MFTSVLGRYAASTVLYFSEGVDSIGRQLRGDKECPFSGLTNCGRVWRKVSESDAWSVLREDTGIGTEHVEEAGGWAMMTPTIGLVSG